MTNAGAQPGDVLILTKPIGTGILAFAAQIDRAPAGAMEAAARSMAALNKTAAEAMLQFDTHACTDITGFGLMGHLGEVASASKVDVEIILDDLPLLPGVLECLGEGIIPGAVERNRESSFERAVGGENIQPALLDLCFDAQTSGGLLIVVPASGASALLNQLHRSGISEASVIGKVLGRGSGCVHVRSNGGRTVSSKGVTVPAKKIECCAEKESKMSECCSKGHDPNASAPGNEIQQKFMEFLSAANAPGALDAHTKQAIAIALSVLAKCEHCAKAHIKKARGMGFSQEEIDEAAWMAIAFGGSPMMMFYNSVKTG
jgi:AhpD family alkylhydroperoxidase